MNTHHILPPRLKKGQSIGIIAPADPVLGVFPREKIEEVYKYFKRKGFSVVEGKSMYAHVGHTAGSVDLRISDIHEFVLRDDIGCIMAFWGGFNSNQLLGNLDFELIAKHPKIFIGFSDVTALTTAITQKTNLITFSGPGVISFAKPDRFEYTWDAFEKMCIEPTETFTVPTSNTYADDLYFLREDSNHRIIQKNEGVKVYKEGKVTAEIVAGNLQTLLVLGGTPYAPDMKNKLLFIEEDETVTPALLDRFMTQCRQMGVFNSAAGVVFGRFTSASGFTDEDSFKSILEQYFSGATYPVVYNVDFGHSDPLCTIPNGGLAAIEATASDCSITFYQSVK